MTSGSGSAFVFVLQLQLHIHVVSLRHYTAAELAHVQLIVFLPGQNCSDLR